MEQKERCRVRRAKKPTQPIVSVEYFIEGDSGGWCVKDFAALSSDIGILQKDLPAFHAFAQANPQQWAIVRMRYGINPIIPRQGADPDMLRVFTLEEIATRLSLSAPTIAQGHLEVIAAAWRRKVEQEQPAVAPTPQPPANVVAPAPSLKIDAIDGITPDQSRLLAEFGFPPEIFDGLDRPTRIRDAEVAWFGARVEELQKMFREPMAKSLARQALLNELFIRRFDDQLTRTPVASELYLLLSAGKQETEKIYQKQWEQLEEICPYIKGAIGKRTFAGVVSDLLDAWIAWKADGNNELIDGVFTNFEVQVQMRQSQQAEVKYRPGLVAAINEAKEGIADPKWRRRIPHKILKMLDAGFLEAIKKMNEEGELGPLIDLESEHPNAEYPDLVDAADVDEEIIPPKESVKLEA
jgi:hypothetical protein